MIRSADTSAIEDAARQLRAGRLVAFPTETVYGLGADATNGRAVAGVYAAKGRPAFNPLIVHVRDAEQAARHVEIPPLAARLAEAFWPGPLTLVLPRRTDSPLSLLLSAGLETVAVRAPAHKVAQALLAAAERPLAAPSANRSGAVSPTAAQHVANSLGDRVGLVLDGGPCAVGVESTILKIEGERAVLLRPGGLARAQIEAVAGPLADGPKAAARPQAPGGLASHYAPRAAVRLNACEAREGETLLGFGVIAGEMNLSPSGDLSEAAANLFAFLRRLDATGASAIAVAPIPHDGLGEAINDRLARAAAPRS